MGHLVEEGVGLGATQPLVDFGEVGQAHECQGAAGSRVLAVQVDLQLREQGLSIQHAGHRVVLQLLSQPVEFLALLAEHVAHRAGEVVHGLHHLA